MDMHTTVLEGLTDFWCSVEHLKPEREAINDSENLEVCYKWSHSPNRYSPKNYYSTCQEAFPKGNSSSNPSDSGAMLVSGIKGNL